jgi:hypothetical protein
MMTAEPVDQRLSEIDTKLAEANTMLQHARRLQADVLAEAAEKIVDRLFWLHENGGGRVSGRGISFARWLNFNFEYDNFYVYVIFDKDEELKKLVDTAMEQLRVKRPAIASAVNRVLQARGQEWGVGSQLEQVINLSGNRYAFIP